MRRSEHSLAGRSHLQVAQVALKGTFRCFVQDSGNVLLAEQARHARATRATVLRCPQHKRVWHIRSSVPALRRDELTTV